MADNSLITGKDTIGKGSGEFVIRPYGLETVLVEDAVSLAEAKEVLVIWEARKLFWKA